MPEQRSELIELCGLWLNENTKGTKYFSGTMGNAKVLIFRNTKKAEGSKEPDYRLFVTAKARKDAGSQPQQDDMPVWDAGQDKDLF
jgi:hypothetical protein